MEKLYKILAFIFFLSAPWQFAWGADFKCGGGIVSVGDRKSEVFFKCGEPDWKSVRTKEIIRKTDRNRLIRRFVDIEEWLYNLGSSRFLRILTFHENRLRDIEIGDYGYNSSDFRAGKNCLRGLEKGDREPEVIVRCGPPSFVEHFEEERIVRTGKGRLVRINVDIAEWIYNFGADRFVRILKFENGRLVSLEVSDYGYDR